MWVRSKARNSRPKSISTMPAHRISSGMKARKSRPKAYSPVSCSSTFSVIDRVSVVAGFSPALSTWRFLGFFEGFLRKHAAMDPEHDENSKKHALCHVERAGL